MFDLERLIAFILVTGMTSLVPGASMLFVMSQSTWRGARSGWAALAGMQLGYLAWWVLAALGLGTLARAYPLAFLTLAVLGALYLAWLGVEAIRHSFHPADDPAKPAREPSRHAFRDGIVVAIGNPKSLVYMVAIIPPFIDPERSIPVQIAILALLALVIDLLIGALYIWAGKGMASFVARPETRRWLDRSVGLVFIVIALAVIIEMIAGTS